MNKSRSIQLVVNMEEVDIGMYLPRIHVEEMDWKGDAVPLDLHERVKTICIQRSHSHSFQCGWDWLLVVLPQSYPIGGYLASLRCGPEENLIYGHECRLSIDAETCVGKIVVENLPFPKYPDPVDTWASYFWVPSKGIFEEMARRAGGWMEALSNDIQHIPAQGHWIYCADEMPAHFVERFSDNDALRVAKWVHEALGPPWTDKCVEEMITTRPIEMADRRTARQKANQLTVYLRRHPMDARAWALLAYMFNVMGRRYRMAVAAKRAVKYAPEWYYARRLYAYALNWIRLYPEAVKQLRHFWDRAPIDLASWHMLAWSYRSMRRYDDLIHALEEALTLDSCDTYVAEELCILYVWRKEYDKAEAACMKLLKSDGKNHWILYKLTQVMCEQEKYDIALPLCEAACAVKRAPDYLAMLGYLHMISGQHLQARAFLEEALSLEPGHPKAYNYYQTVRAR